MRVHTLLAAVLAGLFLPGSADARVDVLDTIKARGVLVVGTKADYQPFGFRDLSGAIVGFEPDLAAEVAKKLGVKLELVPVLASDRISLLTQGKVDLLLATMNETAERRKQVDFVEPAYYASGVNILALKSLHLRVWQQLRAKPVCMIEGSYYIPEIERRYVPDIAAFKNTGELYAALMQGKCVAAIYDDTAIIGQLQQPEWRDYEMPLLSILVEPWGAAVNLGESRFEMLLGDLVKKWHRTGRIEALEKRWNIPVSAFAEEMHRKYQGNP